MIAHRHFFLASAVSLLTLLGWPLASVGQSLKESPQTAGAWIYPSENVTDPGKIATLCREGFSLIFADGRYFSVEFGKPRKNPGRRPAIPATVDEIGRCTFDADAGVKRCTARRVEGRWTFDVTGETRYERQPDGALRFTHVEVVTPTGGKPTRSEPRVAYTMRCPDEAVHDVLSRALPPK